MGIDPGASHPIKRHVQRARHARREKAMDSAESKLPISNTDGSIEVQLVQGTVRFGSSSARRNLVASEAAKTIEGGIRALVRGNRNDVAEPAREPYGDVTVAGTKAIADIERLMGELLVARDYLEAEGERLRQMSARYAHLAQTASASAKIIADSIGKWHNPEPEMAMRLSDTAMSLSPAPSLSPADDGEPQPEPKEPLNQG
jgi:hypothetical protein